MRVIQMGPYPPPHGGVQTNLVAIREYLTSRGIDNVVINLTRHRREEGGGIYYPRSAGELLRLLLRLPHDLIHLHIGGDLSQRLVWACLACCSLPGKRAVLTFHSGGYPGSAAGMATTPRSLRAFAMRRFDGLIAVNGAIAEWFERCGADKRRIRVIAPHAIGAPAQDLPPELGSFYRAHAPVLVSVGLLEPEYDLPGQIAVMEQVRRRYPKAGLVMIGSGSLDAELRARIAETAYSEDLFLAGDVPHDVTLRAIAESSAYLRTTLYDGDSISVREALHIGVPVVATDNRMRPDGCELIPVADADALAAAIARVVERGGGKSGGSTGEENLEAVLQVYREVMGQ